MIQFGAIEIPIGVPAADQTLAILGRIDERAQMAGQHIAAAFQTSAVAARQATGAFLTVEQALEAETNAARAAASSVTPALDAIGEHSMNLSRRFEHLGVMSAFAFTSLANDSERGLTRLAHGVAMLGFAFGPVVGAITTFVAVAGEQLIDFWHRAAAAAEKANKANRDFLDSAGEAKNLGSAAGRQQQLYSGSDYTTEKDPILRAGIQGGGIRGLTASIGTLRTEYDKLQKTVEGMRLEDVPKKTADRMTQLMGLIDPLQQKLDALKSAYSDTKTLTDSLVASAVHDESGKDTIATRREKLNAEHELYVTQSKGNYDKLIYLADWWVGQTTKEYGEGSREQLQALREQAQVEVEIGEKRVEDQKRINAMLGDEHTKELERQHAEDELYAQQAAEDDRKANERATREKKRHAEESIAIAKGTATIIDSTVKGLMSGGITGGLRALGDSVLKMLGDYFMRLGEQMLAASGIFEMLAGFLAAPFDPGSGVGMALGGAALIALGAAMGAAGGGGGGGGGSGGGGFTPGPSFAHNITATINPNYAPNTAGVTAKQPITVNATFFGKRDPTAQRDLLEMIQYATARKV